MKNLLRNWFKRLFTTEEQLIEDYLAHSDSLVDLENRQKELRSLGYRA